MCSEQLEEFRVLSHPGPRRSEVNAGARLCCFLPEPVQSFPCGMPRLLLWLRIALAERGGPRRSPLPAGSARGTRRPCARDAGPGEAALLSAPWLPGGTLPPPPLPRQALPLWAQGAPPLLTPGPAAEAEGTGRRSLVAWAALALSLGGLVCCLREPWLTRVNSTLGRELPGLPGL